MDAEGAKSTASHGKSSPRGITGVVADLCGEQSGRVSRRQLLAAGIGHGAINHRLSTGQLIPVLPGVFAVGHASRGRQADLWAAHLYVGADSVFSHQSSGELAGIFKSASPLIAMTAPRRMRSRPQLRVHRSALPADEITTIDGLPATIVSRTILDLAAVLDRRRLERVLEEVHKQEMGDPIGIEGLLDRYPGRRGAGRLRRLLDDWKPGSSWTRSPLEERFIRFLDRHGIPRGQANAAVETAEGWPECDHVWRRERVVVELDSRAHHSDWAAIKRDAAKRRAVAAAGWSVVVVTDADVSEREAGLEADLRRLLAGGSRAA